jgi:hypothetical protein
VYVVVALVFAESVAADNSGLDALAADANAQLAAAGVGVEVGSIELFTLGSGRPADRDPQNQFRWVPYDARAVPTARS